MKAKIHVVDLQIHTLEESVGEGNDPVDCYINTLTDLDEEERQEEAKMLNSLIKENGDRWVIDCEDGLIFITEITE